MESVETLIPDNEGNHLVVVLNFYEFSCYLPITFREPGAIFIRGKSLSK